MLNSICVVIENCNSGYKIQQMQQDMKQRGQLGGVLQYLSDEAVYSLIKNLSKHIKKNGLIVSRDILAFEHRFFSSNDYPCVYRTKNGLFDLFRRNGFSLLYSKENMFPLFY